MEEVARIGGCSNWAIFWRVMFPWSRRRDKALSILSLPSYAWSVAFTVPERLGTGGVRVTGGERKVFASLRDHLPEDYLVYYNLRVKDRHPDFIVIGPDLGVVILEVKDWRLQTIAGTSPEGVIIRGEDGEHVVQNPLAQARDYALRTVDLLKARPALRAGNRLCCGWGYGSVLPSLTASDIQEPSLFGPTLEDALGAGLVLTADDLTDNRLLPRLRGLIPPWAARLPVLTPDQVDEIRAVLYPEIRVGWGRSDAEILEVMDREQERLARSLGDGHRLLRGVAGSGKTIALIGRARHLREVHPTWRILVLCFSKPLADFLKEAIDSADDQLEVLTFHAWCGRQLRTAGITTSQGVGRGAAWHDYWEHLPRLLLESYAADKARTGTYQAILIDEGQDFADDWYRIILKALDPTSNSLFIALDSSQNIYKRTVSWRDIGIQAAGRTRILRVNYRNTRAILNVAYRVISELDSSSTGARAPEEEYVVPGRAVRNGPPPEVRRLSSREDSRRFALEWIQARLARGVPPRSMLLLGLNKLEIEQLSRWLNQAGIPASLVGTTTPQGNIRVSTIHSAKGFDAGHVLLLGGHELEQRDEEDGRRLLYIAMTRASEELCVCYHRDSKLMNELEAALAAMGTTG